MRRALILLAAFAVAATSLPQAAYAQRQRGGDADKRQQEEAAKKKKRSEEWGDNKAPLPALRNAGPCPFVKVLYDAARYVEFKGPEASGNVAYTGELQGISAGCAYKDDQPIQVTMELLFEMGKGPQATSASKTYRYWVAVTDRNKAILAKQYFDIPVTFASGQDRAYVTEEIGQVTIPRASMTTSGSNFEVLVGFDVTPQMAAFNREGKRFRLNVGTAVAEDTTTRR